MAALESLGFGPFFAAQMERLGRTDLVPARIASEGRGQYRLRGCRAPLAEVRGRMHVELGPLGWPVVGDWVAVADDDERAIIHQVLERRTAMTRRAAGSESDVQVIAANLDLVMVVTSANRDFNVRRLERYLAAVWNSGAEPVVVLNKIDLESTVEAMVEEIGAVAIGVPVVRTSALTGAGLDEVRQALAPGRTVGLVGSSGVGKSSIINALVGRELQAVQDLRRDDRGRHTTTRREFIELAAGGILIDTPGMRELGLADDTVGLAHLFADIAEIAAGCHFRDCEHRGEPGCAVAAAVESGALDGARLASYHKLQREIAAAERRRDPVLGSNAKRRWKSIHKAARDLARHDPRRKP